jgi:hypothetical protein
MSGNTCSCPLLCAPAPIRLLTRAHMRRGATFATFAATGLGKPIYAKATAHDAPSRPSPASTYAPLGARFRLGPGKASQATASKGYHPPEMTTLRQEQDP